MFISRIGPMRESSSPLLPLVIRGGWRLVCSTPEGLLGFPTALFDRQPANHYPVVDNFHRGDRE